MRHIVPFFLLLATCLHATPPDAPGPVLEGEAEAAWTPLFEALAKPRPIFSTFIEQRWFGFRKTPVELQGEMRLDPQRGLSLFYYKPEDRVVIMDAKGLVIRDAHGTRELPSDRRAGGIEQALLPALRFDLPQIRTSFLVHAARDGADWRLDLEPKDPALGRTLGNLIIQGTDHAVTQLEFRRSASQRIVIRIVYTLENVPFDDTSLQRFFR